MVLLKDEQNWQNFRLTKKRRRFKLLKSEIKDNTLLLTLHKKDYKGTMKTVHQQIGYTSETDEFLEIYEPAKLTQEGIENQKRP